MRTRFLAHETRASVLNDLVALRGSGTPTPFHQPEIAVTISLVAGAPLQSRWGFHS